jgi:hypothetical protein
MKPGDMVRYKIFPHEKLHNSGMVGVVLSEPYANSYWPDMHHALQVDVMWDRNRGRDSGQIAWDYIDELEVINAR